MPSSPKTRDDTGRVFTRTTTTYTSRTLATGSGGATVSNTRSSPRSASTSSRAIRARAHSLTEADQDDYGNVTVQRAGARLTATTHSSVTTRRDSAHLRERSGRLASGLRRDGGARRRNGTRVASSRKYYDGDPIHGLPLGQVTRGDVSREEHGSVRERTTSSSCSPLATTPTGSRSRRRTPAVEAGISSGRRITRRSPASASSSMETVLVETADVDGRFGNLRGATDYTGQTTRYGYDAFGRLTRVIKPGDTTDAPTETYSYDAEPRCRGSSRRRASCPGNRRRSEAKRSSTDSGARAAR